MLKENEYVEHVANVYIEFFDDFYDSIGGICGDILNRLPTSLDEFDKLTILCSTLIQFYSNHVAKIIVPHALERRLDILEKFRQATYEQSKELQEDFKSYLEEVKKELHGKE